MKVFDYTKGLFKMTNEANIEGRLSKIPFILITPLLSLIPGIIVGMFFTKTIGYNANIIKNFFQFNLTQYTSGAILIYYLIVKFKEKRSFSSIGLKISKKSLIQYVKGFFIGIFMMAIVSLIIVLSGSGKFNFSKNLIGWSFLRAFIYAFVSWFVLGCSQEIMMRGYIMTALAVKKGVLFSIIITSVYFALIHLTGKGINLLALLNLFIFGLFTSIYAIYEENLFGVCAFHFAWNFSQGNIFGFCVSGDTVAGGSFISTEITNINIINGGHFGPEAGITVTIILICSLLIVSYLQFTKVTYTKCNRYM